jgi:hypothetical protein
MENQSQIKVSHASRLITLILTPLGTILFLIGFCLFSNFLMDLDLTDHLNLPRVSRNPNFNICSKIDCKTYGTIPTKVVFNAGLVVFFWIHHIIMANATVKNIVRSIIPTFGIYERCIYIISKYNINPSV